jgi:hypothetical protein
MVHILHVVFSSCDTDDHLIPQLRFKIVKRCNGKDCKVFTTKVLSLEKHEGRVDGKSS